MSRMTWTLGTALGLSTLVAGCIVDDAGGRRGRSDSPTASVPDSGSPIRQESAAKTLADADPDPPADADLKIPPPPVR